MRVRSFHILPLALLPLLAGSGPSATRHQPAFTLRIETLNQHPMRARVSTAGVARERKRIQWADTLVVPPANLEIADSISRIHVVVVGGFAAVRVTLRSRGVPPDSLISEGRDITLFRKANGRFERIWTAQQLIP